MFTADCLCPTAPNKDGCIESVWELHSGEHLYLVQPLVWPFLNFSSLYYNSLTNFFTITDWKLAITKLEHLEEETVTILKQRTTFFH